jgi:hypothetical protein
MSTNTIAVEVEKTVEGVEKKIKDFAYCTTMMNDANMLEKGKCPKINTRNMDLPPARRQHNTEKTWFNLVSLSSNVIFAFKNLRRQPPVRCEWMMNFFVSGRSTFHSVSTTVPVHSGQRFGRCHTSPVRC